jgi:hypothetical protein
MRAAKRRFRVLSTKRVSALVDAIGNVAEALTGDRSHFHLQSCTAAEFAARFGEPTHPGENEKMKQNQAQEPNKVLDPGASWVTSVTSWTESYGTKSVIALRQQQTRGESSGLGGAPVADRVVVPDLPQTRDYPPVVR